MIILPDIFCTPFHMKPIVMCSSFVIYTFGFRYFPLFFDLFCDYYVLSYREYAELRFALNSIFTDMFIHRQYGTYVFVSLHGIFSTCLVSNFLIYLFYLHELP